MARRRMDDLLSESATADAQQMLEESMPAGASTGTVEGTDSVSDNDLAALAQGPAAPVGADMGAAATPSVVAGATPDQAMSPEQAAELQAIIEEAAKRRMLGTGGVGGAGGGGLAGM